MDYQRLRREKDKYMVFALKIIFLFALFATFTYFEVNQILEITRFKDRHMSINNLYVLKSEKNFNGFVHLGEQEYAFIFDSVLNDKERTFLIPRVDKNYLKTASNKLNVSLTELQEQSLNVMYYYGNTNDNAKLLFDSNNNEAKIYVSYINFEMILYFCIICFSIYNIFKLINEQKKSFDETDYYQLVSP